MTLSMTPITLPGVSIRPPSTRPGSKNISRVKKQKAPKRKPLRKRIRKVTR